MNNVREVKIIVGSRVCPVAEYVTNAITDASAGRLIATAFMPERISNKLRMYLGKSVSSGLASTIDADLRHLTSPILLNPLQERDLPSKELDDFHASQKFLE